MSRNTLLADVNEIMMAYYLAGGWSKIENFAEVQKVLEEKTSQLTAQEVADQKGRAKVMATGSLNWTAANGWAGPPSAVWWTARPNVLASAITATPSPGNPTDVLAKFGNDFLGFSAKSTKSSANIGFKNPGAKPIATALGINITNTVKQDTMKVIQEYSLPVKQSDRKPYVRSLKTTEPQGFRAIENAGYELLGKLRNILLQKLQSMSDEDLREHIVDYWLDANTPYPYYIKVTGRGKDGNYSADISDPTNNEKYKALMSDPITVVPVGHASVGIVAGDTKIMKMRYKYESQKMASSLKMSGDPW